MHAAVGRQRLTHPVTEGVVVAVQDVGRVGGPRPAEGSGDREGEQAAPALRCS